MNSVIKISLSLTHCFSFQNIFTIFKVILFVAFTGSPAFADDKCSTAEGNMVSDGLKMLKQGPAYDPVKARQRFETAESRGNVDAAFNHGILHMNGVGVKKSDALAILHFRHAASCGHILAQLNLAQLLASQSMGWSEAAKWFASAAKGGNAIAAYNLGLMYAKGQGVGKSDEEAMILFRQAANAGHRDAMYNLGILYKENAKGEDDYIQSAKFLKQAAELEHAGAQGQLAFMYGRGRGVKKDYKMVHYWAKRAAKNGDPEAIQFLKELERP